MSIGVDVLPQDERTAQQSACHGLGLRGAVPLCHHFLREVVRPGDQVVDATCGNGYDTLLLAELVGADGHVWAIDVQETALTATGERLSQAGWSERVTLLAASHERLAELVPGLVRVIVFNLGFLPGSDQTCRTVTDTTLTALAQSTALLAPGGMVVIAVYTGHAGGDDEGAAVVEWAAGLPAKQFNSWRHYQLNRSATAPFLVLVERAK
jgi:SAM-dependent methyltransferase